MSKKRKSPIKSYSLKNGDKRYKFQIYLYTDELTGKEVKTTKRGFTTYKDAELALAKIKLDVANGTYKKEQKGTYHEVYDSWILQYENTVEESTFVKTAGLFKNHILPAMGDYRIEKISIDICQKHVNEWARKLKGFAKVKAYAAKVLDFAIRRGLLQNNPFEHVEMPKKIRKRTFDEEDNEWKNFYTRDQLLEFLSYSENEDNIKAFVVFRVLAFSGMRKGELFALTWKDVNFSKNEIRINKAVSRGKDNQLYLKSTKTGEPRTLKMDGVTMKILKDWRLQQKKDLLQLGFNTNKQSQLVFSNSKNTFLQPTKTRKWLVHIQNKYDLEKITTHGLRHTHCSLLFEAGASLKEVQDRLGHSDIQTTMNIYTHVTEKSQENAVQKFADYLEMQIEFECGFECD